jgi:hypothetical protein
MAKNLTLGVAEYVLLLKDEMSNVASSAFDAVEKKGQTLSDRFNMVGVAATAMGGAIVGGLTMAVASAAESEQAMAQLDAVLKSTGGAAGMTRDELTNLAESLQKVTTYDDEAIIGAESLMLTFTKIGKEVFPQAIATVLDMSTALGQDLQSSTVQLGKALNDPIKGITALSRVGVSFTETQKETIKTMVETGNVLGAQKIILEELSVEFGGSATAAANTLNGALDQLGDSFGNLMEAIGAALLGGEAEGGGLKGFVQDVRDAVDSVTAWIEANPQLASTLTWVAAGLGAVLLVVGPLLTLMANVATIGLFSKALFGVGAAASAAAGVGAGAAVGGAAMGGVAAAAGGGAAIVAGGGGGLAAFAYGLLAVVGLTGSMVLAAAVAAVAFGEITIAGYEYYKAIVDLEESQRSLDETEKKYIDTLREKGGVIDDTRLKGMDEAQQRAYLAAQETAERETLARAWFTYFAERTESETDFARMKNLMLNEAIDAEEAAFLVSQHLSEEKIRMVMQGTQEETDTILQGLGFQRNESEATHQAITASAAGAARERQDAYIESTIAITNSEQELANQTLGIWDGIMNTIKGYWEWISWAFSQISSIMATGWIAPPAPATGPVPGLATGGIVKTGGIVDVHKNERIILPAGSDVVPARHSKQVDAMMNGGGGEININIGTVQMASDMDVREVGRQLGREVKKQLRMRGVTTAFGSA